MAALITSPALPYSHYQYDFPLFAEVWCNKANKNQTGNIINYLEMQSSSKQQVYPEDYSCIVEPVDGKGGLFIGNLQAAQNLNTLKKLQVRALLTAAKGVEIGHPKTEVPYFLYVPAEDHQSFDIGRYFHQAGTYIHDCLQRTNIMVHCLAGVSRSVSLVLAYFLKHRGMTYSQAYDLVKTRRKIIHPNDGFIQQLKRFQRELPTPVRQQSRSLSPQKLMQRREFSANCSPNKQPRLDIDGRQPRMGIDSILSRYEPYRADCLRNPESQLEARRDTFSPQKTRLKRFSSINVESSYQTQHSQVLMNRSKIQVDYRPLGSLENRAEQGRDYADIDKRIEEIRKKYQEYAPLTNASKYAYIGEQNLGARGRAGSSYADYKSGRDYTYGGYDRRELAGHIQPNRLKRLTSYQEY